MSGEDKLMSRKYSLGDPNVMRLPDDDSLHSGNVLPTGGDAARPPIRGSMDGGGGGVGAPPPPTANVILRGGTSMHMDSFIDL